MSIYAFNESVNFKPDHPAGVNPGDLHVLTAMEGGPV